MYRLEEVQVREDDDHPGATTLDRNFIKLAPSATGTVTDALRGKSNIQFDQNSRSGALGGEIAPPRISIRGSKHYENNFTLNGVSNNSNMNPGGLYHGEAAAATGQPRGEAQNLFLDRSLLESITVYSENISAEYGGFTGGVVDAKLRDARMDRWHVMGKYRHTNDLWTKMRFTEDQSLDRENSSTADLQPKFRKHEYSASFDGPLFENLGV
ncbi:MAG: Plug domain-containing protein, partial [Desulfovibrio sp.]|nr:Plug domain-containing protein [Desulfovibrio sp.]